MTQWNPDLAERQRQRRAKQKLAKKRVQRRLAQNIIALAAQGTTRSNIARQLALNPETIRRVLKLEAEGIEATARRGQRVDREKIRKLFAAGITKAEIARRLHVSWTSVSRALEGVPAAPVADRNVRRQRALEVLNLFDQGVGKAEIACRLRVGKTSIDKLVAIRNAGGTPILRQRPPLSKAWRRRAQRIALITELTQGGRRLGNTELARCLAVHPSTIYGDRISAALQLAPSDPARERATARDDRRARARDLAGQGLPKSAIALRLGVGKTTIGRDLSGQPSALWSELEQRDQRARDLFAQGMTRREISERLGVSVITLSKALKFLRHPSAEQRLATKVRPLLARGIRKKQIARRLDIDPQIVYAVRTAIRPRLWEKIATRAQALYSQGLSRAAIERELRVSRGTLDRALASNKSLPFFRRRTPRHPQRQRALEVLDLVGRGLSKAEICRQLKVGRTTIRRVVSVESSGGVATIRPRRKPNPVSVRRLFNQGVSRDAIARRLGISRPSVLTALGAQPSIPTEQAARIRELFERGTNKTEISRLFQMTWRDVHRVLLATPTVPPKRRRRLPQSRMLTLEKFTAALQVEVGPVREAVARGEIRGSIELGRQILIPRSEVERLLRGRRTELNTRRTDKS